MRKSIFNHMVAMPEGDYGLYNFFSGKYVRLDIFSKDYYDNPDLYGQGHPKVKALCQNGFLVDYDEIAYLRSRIRMDSGRADTVRLSLCPTLQCDFACPYCFETHRGGRMTDEVMQDVLRFAERLLRFYKAEKLHVIWFGGEPLLCPDIIRELSAKLMALCAEKKITYGASIITNGYHLTGETAELFETCRITRAQVTMDGPDAETHDKTRYLRGGEGTFDRILSNIQSFPGDCWIDIRCNVQRENRDSYQALEKYFQDYAKSTGRKIGVYAGFMDGHDAFADSEIPREEFIAFKKKTLKTPGTLKYRGPFCTFSKSSEFMIDERGNLCKCLESVGVDEDIIGNVKDFDPFLPYTGNMDVFIRCLEMIWPEHDEECMHCPILPACLGGCPQKRRKGKKRCLGHKSVLDEYVMAVGEERKRRDRG